MWTNAYPSNCPPQHAIQDNVDPVYRLVISNNITRQDFEPHLVRHPNRPFKDKCIAAGTSVYETYTAIAALKKKIPAFKNMLIAEGKITLNDGLIKRGKNNHITWWVSIQNPQTHFRVVP